MITCPHCDRHVRPSADGSAFPCPLCGETIDVIDTASGGKSKWLMLGIGVGVAVAATVTLTACPQQVPPSQPAPPPSQPAPPPAQPAYGVAEPIFEPPSKAPPTRAEPDPSMVAPSPEKAAPDAGASSAEDAGA